MPQRACTAAGTQGRATAQPGGILFWPKMAGKGLPRIGCSGDSSCGGLLDWCHAFWWRPPSARRFHRRERKRTSTGENRPHKSSRTPATHAIAVRGKSGRPAPHFCGNIIPLARSKRRPSLHILPRWVATRGRFSSDARRPWARARPPHQRSMNRRVETIRRHFRGTASRRPRSGLGDRPRAWKRAISPSLLRRAAAPWPAQRKLQQERRPGNPLLTSLRNSAEAPAPRSYTFDAISSPL